MLIGSLYFSTFNLGRKQQNKQKLSQFSSLILFFLIDLYKTGPFIITMGFYFLNLLQNSLEAIYV